jgi:hypothetical protein
MPVLSWWADSERMHVKHDVVVVGAKPRLPKLANYGDAVAGDLAGAIGVLG